jgi:hypothetical protein
MSSKIIKLSELIPDPNNANRGTPRGRGMLEKSLQKLGAGRSILVDKNNVAIAGNKTLETAVESGFEDAIIVESDGTKLVVVRRTDLDMTTDAKAKELAIADNRVGQVSLDWDVEVLADLDEAIGLGDWFVEGEIENLIGSLSTEMPTPEEMWEGMPEFNQPNAEAVKSIKVNFKTYDDLYQFAELIGQKLTEKTTSINFPYEAPIEGKAYRCGSES